jgi:phosphosulfolactate synthase (CoM biosynthesis protein A)
MNTCLGCGGACSPRAKYCSNKCHQDLLYRDYITRWLAGEEDGIQIGGMTSTLQIRRYLKDKYGNACQECGWSEVNITTGKVPLQIDHVDGI